MSSDSYVAERDQRIRIRLEMFLSKGEDKVTGYSVDMSLHGLSAIASHPFSEGDRLVVGLFLDMEKTLCVVAEGQVTWTEGTPPEEGDKPALGDRLGIRFLSFRGGGEERLRAFLRGKGVEIGPAGP